MIKLGLSILYCISFFLGSKQIKFEEKSKPKNPPNVIVIFVDDMGYGDLSSYGHPTIRTPHLDQMAHEGMRFTQFYVAAPVCTPSRAGLLTGRYPVRTGLVEGIMKGGVLFPDSENGLKAEEVTIAEVLKQKDYATMAVGKWHLGHLPQYLPTTQGFDEYYGIPYSNDMDYIAEKNIFNVPLMHNEDIIERPAEQTTLTKRYTEKALDFISDNKDKPFFLYLAHSMPHIPLFASNDFEGKSKRGLYGDVVEELDWSVGQILKKLKELKLENTLVIFTSDNGPWLMHKEKGGSAGLLKDGKGTTWEGGYRVPMVAWWPTQIPKGIVNEDVTNTLDLLPTIAALSDTKLPETQLDGQNILSSLKGEKAVTNDAFMFYRGKEVFAVRSGQWKAHFITQTAYPSGPKNVHNPPLLFNLENDPSEKYNVSEAHPDIIEKIIGLKKAHEKTVKSFEPKPNIEAEDFIDNVTVSHGSLKIQNMPVERHLWGNDQQLWWVEAQSGATLKMPITIEESGLYKLDGFFTKAKDYSIIQLSVNGKKVGELVDGFAEGVQPTGAISYGEVQLNKGINNFEIEIVGKDYKSSGYSNGYLVGIDGFSIEKIN
ncbi:sulfatase-like hydrolase/transferase [Mangrovimonas sp. ST2L15]|uniref:sulfatase-like hydrolase/transferase n=1 Tax=Mangrovimonas sp. ST2L15 TaxID=1645916 RepID=UPI0009E710E1|nr:sulfatase-like hydrolase/transferase [Mangrovimonas sp. ST2L15]